MTSFTYDRFARRRLRGHHAVPVRFDPRKPGADRRNDSADDPISDPKRAMGRSASRGLPSRGHANIAGAARYGSRALRRSRRCGVRALCRCHVGPGRWPLGSTRDLKLSPTSSPRLEDHRPSLRESRGARCDSARSDAGNRSVPDRRRPLRANGRTNGRTGARSGASERSCPPPPFGDALRSFGASGFRDWHCCASFSTIVTRPVR
jgi:hypothetical protein